MGATPARSPLTCAVSDQSDASTPFGPPPPQLRPDRALRNLKTKQTNPPSPPSPRQLQRLEWQAMPFKRPGLAAFLQASLAAACFRLATGQTQKRDEPSCGRCRRTPFSSPAGWSGIGVLGVFICLSVVSLKTSCVRLQRVRHRFLSRNPVVPCLLLQCGFLLSRALRPFPPWITRSRRLSTLSVGCGYTERKAMVFCARARLSLLSSCFGFDSFS